MRSTTWHVERLVLVLITGGFFVHLVHLSRYFMTGSSRVGDVLMWPVDLVLGTLMAYCAAGLILRRREMAEAFDISSTARKLGYWLITFYITASVPGHILFLTTGNTAYFDVFPWWFSLIIEPVYVLIIAYFVTLGPREGTVVSAGT